MLNVTTWLWGDKFGAEDVAKLAAGVRRHLKQEHKFWCITDRPRDLPVPAALVPNEALFDIRGCFARLRLFSPAFQKSMGLTDRIVNIDLDTVITGPLDLLFDRPESFVIMQKGNASNPCPYNGALMMLRAGAHPDVWADFSIEAAGRVAFYEFPDDQGWIWNRLPRAAGWKCGRDTGVYVFRKPGWPSFDRKMKRGGDDLPSGARLVTFSGGRSPQKYAHLDWIKKNWVA